MRVSSPAENTAALQLWSSWQKTISEITGMAITMVDYRGVPVTGCEGSCEFCKIIRQDEEFGKYCQKCDALGSLEAVMTEQPYVYQCHFSIVDVAVPIIRDNCYVGSIVAGHVRLEEQEDIENLMHALHIQKRHVERKKKDLLQYYEQIPVFNRQQLNNAVSIICSCSESLMKRDMVQTLPISNGGMINGIVAQAIDYVCKMQPKKISLTEVAEHCHVSVSYLSRLFSRETGENYSEYVSKLKVKWAKERLEDTDMTISEISDELGYGEPGYFTKTFKRYEQETPCNYRTRYKRDRMTKCKEIV